MKIAIVVTDGIGLKNYLYTDLLSQLFQSDIEVAVWTTFDVHVFEDLLHKSGEKLSVKKIAIPKEDKVCTIVREISYLKRLKKNVTITGNQTILNNWRPKKNTLLKKLYYAVVETLSQVDSSFLNERVISEFLDNSYRKSYSYTYFKAMIQEEKPDFIFFTHQRIFGLIPAVLAANDLNVPTVSSIYSWDNLPKGNLYLKTNYHFVWSDYMKKEFELYYPEINQEHVIVAGSPQFDVHFVKEQLVSRQEFALEHDLDIHKKWILFSGDDILTSPMDDLYLFDLANALKDFPEITILFRPVPSEMTNRYDYILDRCPNVKRINPAWQKSLNWMNSYPLQEDLALFSNLCFHCELVANLGSTVALDFACFNKPALYFNYNPMEYPSWDVKTIFSYQHFQTMTGLDAVGWINHPDTILKQILELLQDKNAVGKDRTRWLTVVSDLPNNTTSSEKISQFFHKFQSVL